MMSAAVLLAACSTKIGQPEPGVGLGEIYLTAPAGSKTVAVDLDGLWRVYTSEPWISLDVNGREGHGAFTFSYGSNESDFAHVNPTRLGYIIIQSLVTMKADTLYVRQQGTPDGKEYVSHDDSGYIEFVDADLTRTVVTYVNFDGVDDMASVTNWIDMSASDVIAAVCSQSLADYLASAYPQKAVRRDGLVVIASDGAPEIVSAMSAPVSLTAKVGDVTYVVADFDKEVNVQMGGTVGQIRYHQVRNLLEDGYNAPLSNGKWLVGGTFWYLSAMEAGYPFTPDWYPTDPAASDFDADLYAWENNLLDCVWMVKRDYTPTFTDEDDMTMSWRPSYVYASTDAWNAVVSLEVLDVPMAGMKHKPITMTLKY